MILDLDKFRPIRNFAMVLTMSGVFILSIYLIKIYLLGKIISNDFKALIVFSSLVQVFSGLLITSRRPLGYKVLKLHLKLIMLAFPFGTSFARQTFRYIEENDIKSFYAKSSITL